MSAGPPREVSTGIDFGIRGTDLRIREITAMLGFEPTRAFEKGDTYKGKQRIAGAIQEVDRKHPFGVWHFCTAPFVDNDSLDQHALFLLGKLEPVHEKVLSLVRDSGFFVRISVWYVGADGFGIASGLIGRLAALSEEINVTCWEVEEDN